MGKVRITVPISITDDRYFDVKLTEMIFNQLDGDDFNTVIKSLGQGDLAIFCKYCDREQIEYILSPFEQKSLDMILEHMMFMGPIEHDIYTKAIDRILPQAVMTIKKERIKLPDNTLTYQFLEQLDPMVPESEIVFREWLAKQASLIIKDYMQINGLDCDTEWHSVVDEKEKLYSSGCVKLEPECEKSIIPQVGYEDIKVGLSKDQKGYLQLKLLSFIMSLLGYDNYIQRVLIDAEEELIHLYPYIDDITKENIEKNLSGRSIKTLMGQVRDGTSEQACDAAKSLLAKILKMSKLEDLDLGPFDALIACINDMYSEHLVSEDPCKKMVDAVNSFLHIY